MFAAMSLPSCVMSFAVLRFAALRFAMRLFDVCCVALFAVRCLVCCGLMCLALRGFALFCCLRSSASMTTAMQPSSDAQADTQRRVYIRICMYLRQHADGWRI